MNNSAPPNENQRESEQQLKSVLIKACLNGSRRRDEHASVPVSSEELASEARAAVVAGAAAVHVHPRGPDGLETLDPDACGAAVQAIRRACPGVPMGLTTAAWVEPDPKRRLSLIRNWKVKPDFASVNFGEDGAYEVCDALIKHGVEIEAGIWSVSDAKLYLGGPFRDTCLRVLVEVVDSDSSEAVSNAARIDATLNSGGSKTRRLHHGYGMAAWAVMEAALGQGHDIRVGLEDTVYLPDGRLAKNNADLISAAVEMARRCHLTPFRLS